MYNQQRIKSVGPYIGLIRSATQEYKCKIAINWKAIKYKVFSKTEYYILKIRMYRMCFPLRNVRKAIANL
jgi:hypothetical protein